MKLKTKTKTLSTREIRKIVGETILWSKKTFGSKQKFKTLKFRVLTLPENYSPSYGKYNVTTNTIIIYKNVCSDVKDVVTTTLHEYKHFLQDLSSYQKKLEIYGYEKHPYEVDARDSELFYSDCWKNIKHRICDFY